LSFWLPAIAIPLAATLVLCWPILRRGSQLLGMALPLLLLIPVSTLFLYQIVGTPEGIDVTGAPHSAPADLRMDDAVAQLRARLEQQPKDLDGWLLLSRSYKAMQQYEQALGALQRARELAPDNPVVTVELAEAMIFTSGSPKISGEVRAMIQGAVQRQPDLQKGLWLLGIIAFHAGSARANGRGTSPARPRTGTTSGKRLGGSRRPG
jgi:cytochrome c-type biogenesis protein CcmH